MTFAVSLGAKRLAENWRSVFCHHVSMSGTVLILGCKDESDPDPALEEDRDMKTNN